MNYQEAISYLEGLKIFGIRLGLTRIERLLELLGRPQDRYRTVHVTGTNGKGSVSAMVEGALRRSGIHTGFYSSPHLVSYTERIRVDGQNISEQDFAAGMTVIREKIDLMLAEGAECPTQFEVLTALGFYYFAKCQVEYAVIEVGLGGTLQSIAENKAGIIKDGVPVVTAAKGEPLSVIRAVAEEKSADIFVAGEDFSSKFISCDGCVQQLEFSSELLGIDHQPYELHLLGVHQVENSAVALMTLRLLHNIDARLTMETVTEALRLVSWPARFEPVSEEPPFIVDGGHNPQCAESVRRNLLHYFPESRRVLLVGVLRDKDYPALFDILNEAADAWVCVTPNSERALPAAELGKFLERYGKPVTVCESIPDGVETAREQAGEDGMACAVGSLYMAGAVRACFGLT